MIPYSERLLHSIVLHPDFMLRDLRTESLVQKFLDRCGSEDDRHLQLAGRLWRYGDEAPCADRVMEIFEDEKESGTPESLALFGEIFIENSSDDDVLERESIDEFFQVLGDKSEIFCSLSRSKRLLKEYLSSGDDHFLISATSGYKKALLNGSLTGLVLYMVFRQSATKSGTLKSIFGRLAIWWSNALYMFVGGAASMGVDYKKKWWRYTEIYQWMPTKVKKIDRDLMSKNIKW